MTSGTELGGGPETEESLLEPERRLRTLAELHHPVKNSSRCLLREESRSKLLLVPPRSCSSGGRLIPAIQHTLLGVILGPADTLFRKTLTSWMVKNRRTRCSSSIELNLKRATREEVRYSRSFSPRAGGSLLFTLRSTVAVRAPEYCFASYFTARVLRSDSNKSLCSEVQRFCLGGLHSRTSLWTRCIFLLSTTGCSCLPSPPFTARLR